MTIVISHVERAVAQLGVKGEEYRSRCFSAAKLSPDKTMLEMSDFDFTAIRASFPRKRNGRCISCEQKARVDAFEAKRKADHAKMLATLTEQHS